MKKVLVLVSLIAAVSAYSQGTVNFNNRVGSSPNILVDAPISYAATAGNPRADAAAVRINGAGSLVVGTLNYGGQFALAGLYGGPVGTAEADLVLLVPATGFRSGAGAGYLTVGSSGDRIFPAQGQPGYVAAGADATVQVRAWDFGSAGVDSWAAAQALLAGGRSGYMGGSSLLTITTGGGGSPPAAPANLIGLTAFSIPFVPEPSIIGLGILGAIGGLMVFRRRS